MKSFVNALGFLVCASALSIGIGCGAVDDSVELGQTQEALTNLPSRYGIDSAANPFGNDTRCPVGGEHLPNNCEVPDGLNRVYNWNVNFDHQYDAPLGFTGQTTVQTIALQALAAINQQSPGWTMTADPTKPYNANMAYDDLSGSHCAAGAQACTFFGLHSPFIINGQSLLVDTPINSDHPVKIRVELAWALAQIPGMTPQQRYFEMINTIMHEVGHTMGLGHVPSAERNTDIMNLDNAESNQLVKSMSPAEISQTRNFSLF